MAGRPRKAPNALAGHRAGRAPLKLVPPSEPAPSAPAGLLTEAATIWVRYWTSASAGYISAESDSSALDRWIWYLDELHRARKAFRRRRFINGSMGQPTLSPLGRFIPQLEAMVRGLEGGLGMTPLARRRLGYALGPGASAAPGGRTAIDDLNDDLDGDAADFDMVDG